MFLGAREMELRKLRFDVSFPPGEIQFFEAKLWQASPLSAEGSAELVPNTGGEIRVRGHLAVVMEAECDRCLETARFPVEADFDLFYEPASAGPSGEEVAIREGETEIAFYEGEGLELEDVLREQVLLALPMQRTCREDCQGICPSCGQNRNTVACDCHTKPVDDRWAALRNL
jgi:uncharacterized protein